MNSANTVKKNFAWSSALTITGYIFPLITFPYVSRVLGVEGIGHYQFADSVIHYFTIFAMLGIGTVGIREIARVKGDRVEMSRVYSSLLSLNLLTSLLVIIVLVILSFFIPSFISHSKMLYIGIARILCGTLLVEWFFKGVENFRYITVRAIIVRCIYVASVFIFVREPDDYILYFFITTMITVVNAAINTFYSRRFVNYSYCNLVIRPYLKPVITLGFYQVLTAMYLSFNVMFLGSVCDDVQVGYYTTATKLYGLIMSFFTAFTGVMLPRMSSLVSEGKKGEFLGLTSRSIDFLLLFCLPIIVISEVYAPQIIRIIAGEGYEGAIVPMRIVMPLMLVIGYEQIIIIQMLSPLRKDKAILTNSCIGASVALILNLTIISRWAAVGSAIVWCCSELVVLTSAQFFVTKYTGYKMPIKKILVSVVSMMPALVVCLVLDYFINNWIVSILVGVAFVGVYFFVLEFFILKNELLRGNIKMIIRIGNRSK